MAKRMDIFSISCLPENWLQSFQYCSYVLTSTYTGGNKAISLLMASTEFERAKYGQASPIASQGAKRYSSTIHIDPIRIQTRFNE